MRAGVDTLVGAPLVSVVIPAHNAQAYLVECLASVRAQAGAFTLQTIVVDDGSRDATADIARQQPGVICLTQPNRGPSAARNAGIAATQGEFIAFLDADDLWPPGKLAAQVDALQRHPEAALVFGDCRQFDAGGPWPQTQFEAGSLGTTVWGKSGLVPDACARLLEDNFITTGSVVVRRAVLAEVGGFAEDLRLVEDLDLWLRIARRHPFAWCARVCLLRRRHAGNTSRDPEAMSLAYLEVLRRHGTPDAGEASTADANLGRLVAREYLHLADLALARGRAGTAWVRAWRSLMARPGPRALWILGRASLMLLAPRSPRKHEGR